MTKLVKLKYTHEAMVDLILAEPGVSDAELAEVFGYTPHWVCTVRNSDTFKARLAERRREVIDPMIRRTVQDRLEGVANHAIDVLSAKLSAEQSASTAIGALGLATTVLGAQSRG